MSKRCVFVAMSSQKGGVGKSTMTVLLAGYFHYVMGYNVAVVDCDYPQFSIKALRSRDTQNVEKNVNLQRMLCGQFDRTGKKAYPVLTSVPGKELKTAPFTVIVCGRLPTTLHTITDITATRSAAIINQTFG